MNVPLLEDCSCSFPTSVFQIWQFLEPSMFTPTIDRHMHPLSFL